MCVYVCMYVYVYIYIYIHVYIHLYAHTFVCIHIVSSMFRGLLSRWQLVRCVRRGLRGSDQHAFLYSRDTGRHISV